MSKKHDSEFINWIAREKKATELINIVGQLWFDKVLDHLSLSCEGYYNFTDEGIL